jgi:hypothetical protein
MEKYKIYMIAQFDGKQVSGWMNDHGYPCSTHANASEVNWEEATGMIGHIRSLPDCENISVINFTQINNVPIFWKQPKKRTH